MSKAIASLIILVFISVSTISSSFAQYEDYRSSTMPWSKGAKNQKQKRQLIHSMLQWISESPSGKKLVTDADKRALSIYKKNLLDLISVSNASVTDSTVLRRFYAHSPHQVSYEYRSSIFLSGDLNYAHATIDLAHELTHFTYKPLVNPYENFDHPVDFIRKVIDGQGGEVDAFIKECEVGKELMGEEFLSQGLCKHFVDQKLKSIDRQKVIKGFYALGEYKDQFLLAIDQLSRNLSTLPESGVNYFPSVSNDSTYLISSAYNLPYPLAAIEEFQKIKTNICRSEWKRISMAQRIKGDPEIRYKFRTISSDIQSKCSDVKN
ncbi:MAG: hypothetical protein QE271_08495 [Bacteriovoracaceae bacterium]|nr:hypothetical protein [Bacteriovoracaceae bacterium]